MELDLSYSDIEVLISALNKEISFLEDNRYRYELSIKGTDLSTFLDGGQGVRDEIEDHTRRIEKLIRIRDELKK